MYTFVKLVEDYLRERLYSNNYFIELMTKLCPLSQNLYVKIVTLSVTIFGDTINYG